MGTDFWFFHGESIKLAAVISVISGPLFAIGHELTKPLAKIIGKKLWGRRFVG